MSSISWKKYVAEVIEIFRRRLADLDKGSDDMQMKIPELSVSIIGEDEEGFPGASS